MNIFIVEINENFFNWMYEFDEIFYLLKILLYIHRLPFTEHLEPFYENIVIAEKSM